MKDEIESEDVTDYPTLLSVDEIRQDKRLYYKSYAQAVITVVIVTTLYCQVIWVLSSELWNYLDLDLISYFTGVLI